MTDSQVFSWFSLLPGAMKNRRAIIRNMLAHANEDHMGSEDRTICVRALELTAGQETDYHHTDSHSRQHIVRGQL